jgi:phosphoribosylamine--glycine ligase
VVVEEFLTGEEISFIALVHNNQAIPLEATQDHKAIYDGDEGPNTGGMGAYCDGRLLTPTQVDYVMNTVIRPTLHGMEHEGAPFSGFLYAGLMMTADGPKVLEFNVRLGDPECQTLMHRMQSDLVATLLENEPITWKPDPSVCVVLAAHGYPGEVRTGDHITGIANSSAQVFHSGTRLGPSGLETAGGRVLGVTASGPDLPAAIANAYAGMEPIHFDGMQFRGDIGHKGLKRW